MATKNRFQIMKSVGSPSVSGAERIETLSNHTNNPQAHPDYMKKGAVPAVFSGGDHLTDKLSHAIYYARRGELCLTKADYDATKTVSYVNNSENYLSTSSIKRHVVTSYVLAQVLTSLGLDGTKKYIETNKIVGTTSTPPSTNIDAYVVSYGLYKRVKDQIDYWLGDHGIEATYLKKTDAETTYATIEALEAHTHDIMDILGVPDILSYALTEDVVYNGTTTYYKYNSTTHTLQQMESTEYTVDEPITGYVFEKFTVDIVGLKTGVSNLNANMTILLAENGYARTCDAKYLGGIVYYEYLAATNVMHRLTAGSDYTVGDDIPSAKKLWVQVRNFNPDTIEPYDDRELKVKSGFALTTDTSWVSGVDYYRYHLVSGVPTMTLDNSHSSGETPVGLGRWCKVKNLTQGKTGYVLTQDTQRVEGVTYYEYNASTDSMVVSTSTTMGSLWVKAYNYRDYETRAKSGYVLTTDTSVDASAGIVYYKYNSSTGTMVVASPTNPAEESCYIKVSTKTSSYDDREWIAKDGYAKTADTTVVSGTQYYKYTEDPVPTMAAHTPAAGDNPYLLGLYVLVKTDIGGGGGSSYDDTQIKKELQKLGYALTTDTTAVSGVTYYKVLTDGSMSAYATAPSNPASVSAWVKVGNYRFDATELTVKSGYAQTADTAAVSGVTYYYYSGGVMVPYATAPSNPSAAGCWCKIKNNNGSGSSYDDTELRNRITALESKTEYGYKPDWSNVTNLNITRTASTNIWTIDTIPIEGTESILGTIVISFNLTLDANTYCQVQAMDSCCAEWVPIQNCLCFHTYTNSSAQNVCRINFTGRCGSGDQFRIVVKSKSTDTDAKYSSTYKEYTYVPTKIVFVKEYQ